MGCLSDPSSENGDKPAQPLSRDPIDRCYTVIGRPRRSSMHILCCLKNNNDIAIIMHVVCRESVHLVFALGVSQA